MRRLGRFFSGELTAGRLVFWGGLVTLLYAVLSTGVYHPDEHFQILEYDHICMVLFCIFYDRTCNFSSQLYVQAFRICPSSL